MWVNSDKCRRVRLKVTRSKQRERQWASIKARIYLRLLGSEAFLHTENVTKGGKASFEIELRGLGEVSWLAVVVETEEC